MKGPFCALIFYETMNLLINYVCFLNWSVRYSFLTQIESNLNRDHVMQQGFLLVNLTFPLTLSVSKCLKCFKRIIQLLVLSYNFSVQKINHWFRNLAFVSTIIEWFTLKRSLKNAAKNVFVDFFLPLVGIQVLTDAFSQ